MENENSDGVLPTVPTVIASFEEGPDPRNAALARCEIAKWGGIDRPLEWAKRYYGEACKPHGSTAGSAFVSIPFSIQSIFLHFAAETEICVNGAVSEVLGREIAFWAKTDFDTFTLAQMLVIDASTKNPKLPTSLHALVEEIASGSGAPKKKGDRAWKLLNRNRIGIAILNVLTHADGFNIPPTRSVATSGVSGCDILAEAASGFGWVSITKEGANEIWRNRERWFLEWHLCVMLKAFMDENNRHLPTELTLFALNKLKAIPSGRKAKNQPDEKQA